MKLVKFVAALAIASHFFVEALAQDAQQDFHVEIADYNAEILPGSRALSQEELMAWIREANGGLGDKITRRISNEISFSSLGDFVAWSFDSNSSMLGLTSSELNFANQQLANRFNSRNNNLNTCRSKLVGKSDLDESIINNALRQLHDEELKCERKLYESLEEILDPKRKKLLSRTLIKHGLQSVRVPMVVDYLELSPKQVELFRIALASVLKSLEMRPPEIGLDTTKKILAAENSLNLKQFTIYAQCVGKLEEGKTLREHLEQLDSQKRKELCEAYVLFREASQQ